MLAPYYRDSLKLRKYLSFMEIMFFVFSVEAFQFSKFLEKEAKHYKLNFEEWFDRDIRAQKFVKLLKN